MNSFDFQSSKLKSLYQYILIKNIDVHPFQPNNEVNMAIENSIYSRFFAIENRRLIIADESLGFGSDELVGTKIPLNLTISDRGNPSLSSLQSIEIEIDDRNDELPQFESFTTQESVLENRPIGYSIGTFGRTDVDLNSNISASLSCSCFKNDEAIFRSGFATTLVTGYLIFKNQLKTRKVHARYWLWTILYQRTFSFQMKDSITKLLIELIALHH